MYFFYVLKSKRLNSCYYGFTCDLRRRLKEHNRGSSSYTKAGIPWNLVYYEAYVSRKDAEEREKQIKRRKNAYRLLLRRIKNCIEY